MGWAVGYDDNWKRDIGYGIIAYCDHPDCNAEIDRGLAYVCADSEPRGGDGCGLYFCDKHRGHAIISEPTEEGDEEFILNDCCERCSNGLDSFPPKPEHPFWIRFKLLDPSWAKWREESPDEVKEFEERWAKLSPEVQADAEAKTKEEMAWQAEGDIAQ